MVRTILATGAVLVGVLAGLIGLGGAAAQSTQPNDAAAMVQQIHDTAYSRCMAAGKMGAPGSELQSNCSCAADVAVSLLSDEFKQAIAAGTQATFKGQMLKGDEMYRDLALLKTCPKVGEHLHQQYCGADVTNPHCQALEKAQQQAQ